MATATEPEVITLGASAVERLTRGGVSAAPVSPLSTVLRGGAVAAAPSDEDLAAFRESIAIVAQPEAYVRILILRPGEEDEQVIGLLVRQGQGVSFSLGDDLLHLGRAQPLERWARWHPRRDQGPLAGNDVWLWPSVLQLLTGLWQDNPDPARTLSRSEIVAKLTTPDYPQADAEKFVEGVVGSGAVRLEGDTLSIDPALRPWLAALWSGHAAQVEYVPLAPDASLEQAIDGPRTHLLFMGQTPQRVRNEAVTGEALVAHLGGRKPREESMLHLQAQPVDDVAKALRQLLKVQA
jgi:hypothetical protein